MNKSAKMLFLISLLSFLRTCKSYAFMGFAMSDNNIFCLRALRRSQWKEFGVPFSGYVSAQKLPFFVIYLLHNGIRSLGFGLPRVQIYLKFHGGLLQLKPTKSGTKSTIFL